MLRRLITLFALLSGLAAIGAPVQARASQLPGVDLVVSVELRSECAKQQGEQREVRKRPAAEKSRAKDPCRKPGPPIVYFPPVMLKADRARE
jgi:hypothetical protein